MYYYYLLVVGNRYLLTRKKTLQNALNEFFAYHRGSDKLVRVSLATEITCFYTSFQYFVGTLGTKFATKDRSVMSIYLTFRYKCYL